eukprot:COSAG01_NODE_16059_length_1274_cov_1.063830_3_plen_64_part_01
MGDAASSPPASEREAAGTHLPVALQLSKHERHLHVVPYRKFLVLTVGVGVDAAGGGSGHGHGRG